MMLDSDQIAALIGKLRSGRRVLVLASTKAVAHEHMLIIKKVIDREGFGDVHAFMSGPDSYLECQNGRMWFGSPRQRWSPASFDSIVVIGPIDDVPVSHIAMLLKCPGELISIPDEYHPREP